MSWIGVGVVGGLAIGATSLAMSAGGKKGGGFDASQLPDFDADPMVKETQDYLYPLGKNLIEGNIPEWLAPVVTPGSKQFEDVLGMMTRDTQKAVEESAAKRGVGRGGAVSTAVARAVSDTSKELRYRDFLNAIEGSKFIFGKGISVVEGVRTGALQNQQMQNQFALGKYGLDMQAQEIGMKADELDYAATRGLAESGASSIGTMLGLLKYMKPAATAATAGAGASLGSAEGTKALGVTQKELDQYFF